MAWATAVGAHWEKIEAEYNAEWLKLAYLDGPGYTVWDRIEAKAELHRKFFSRSSSHGVLNSPRETLTQPVNLHFTSSMVESNRQHNLRTTEYAQEIRESCARILKLLQEIDATESESKNGALQISDETFPSMEPIDASNSLTVVLPMSKDFLPSKEPTEPSVVIDAFPVLDESLPSMETTEEQSMTDESIGVGNLRMEEVMLMSEILDKPLVRMPILHQDGNHPLTNLMHSTLECLSRVRLNDPMLPPPPKPPDHHFRQKHVEFQVMWNVTMAPPPPEPPDCKYKAMIGNTCQVFAEMSKMFMGCSNSFFCLSITTGRLNEKVLLSYAFGSKCCVIVVKELLIYEVFDLLRWICGTGSVYGVVMFKKKDITFSLRYMLAIFGVILQLSWKNNYYSWLCELNPQGISCVEYGLNCAYVFCNIKGGPICKYWNGFGLMFFHEWKMLEWFDGYVKKNWQVCRDGDMFNHFTRRNMSTVDSILKYIQVVVYGYSVVLFKLLIGKHIHEKWQQKSQEPHSQFGVIVDHDECETTTLFNIGLA
jgi:hypothetical protein